MFVVDSANGSILLVSNTSVALAPVARVLKSGFVPYTLTGLAVGEITPTLYWLAVDGRNNDTTSSSVSLFSGGATDDSATILFNFYSLTIPSMAPSALTVNERFGFAVWLDVEQKCVYRVDLQTIAQNFSRVCFDAVQRVSGLAADGVTGSIYVSMIESENINNTNNNNSTNNFNSSRIIRFRPDLAAAETVFLQSCCGVVSALAVQSLGAIQQCAAGTYTAECLPCREFTYASTPLGPTCSQMCNASQYCALAAAVPIPLVLAVTRNASTTLLFSDAQFGQESVPAIFLYVMIGGIFTITIFFVFLVACCRHYHYKTIYQKIKRACQCIDVCFRGRHYNETPAVMVHRRTILGGFQTLLYPAIFILIGIYIFLSWNASPITTASVVPFGHLRVQPAQIARISFSAIFWGFAGPCSATSLRIEVLGFKHTESAKVTVNSDDPLFCSVTWDTVENSTEVSANLATVTITMQGGHAAMIGYAVGMAPHYLHGLAKHDNNREIFDGNSGFVFDNYANGTVMPEGARVFKGDAPTRASVDVMWAQLNDTTIGTEYPYQSGLLMSQVHIDTGAQADAESFVTATNEVSIRFEIVRSSTFLQVLVQPTGTVGVVLGSVLAFGFTINNALAAGGKVLEWLFRLCKKPRPTTLEFFMRPYEGTELESMAGFRQHITEDDIKMKFMRREEHSAGLAGRHGEQPHSVAMADAPNPADTVMDAALY